MKQIFNKLKDAVVTPDIPTIEARRARALEAFEAALAAVGSAVLDDDGLEVARKALAIAESTLVEVDASLDAAKARLARADTDAEAKHAEVDAKLIAAGCAAISGTLAELDQVVDKLRDLLTTINEQFEPLRQVGADVFTLGKIQSVLPLVIAHKCKGLARFEGNVLMRDQDASMPQYAPDAASLMASAKKRRRTG